MYKIITDLGVMELSDERMAENASVSFAQSATTPIEFVCIRDEESGTKHRIETELGVKYVSDILPPTSPTIAKTTTSPMPIITVES